MLYKNLYSEGRTPNVTAESYERDYKMSLRDNDGFWADKALEYIDWFKPWHTVNSSEYEIGRVRWYEGARLNACFNCVDRHLPHKANDLAFIFESDSPDVPVKEITYQQLHDEVCKVANALKKLGVHKGDRVCLYMPMVPEAIYTMLACARIGAVHSVVFGGFSAEALKTRIEDAEPTVVVTADEGLRGGKSIPLKNTTDEALDLSNFKVPHVLVVRRTGADISMKIGRDHWYHHLVSQQKPDCPVVQVESTDPLFILYTSGSTGKPKGVVHGTGGYMVYSAMTHKLVFDYQPGDIYWCTADVGWITGHSYVVYGPLANGATSVIFEGVPQYPDWGRFWDIVEKYRVNIFYTAPTAIRAIQAQGDKLVKSKDLSSLRVLGTVGEPINPEAWRWYHDVVGGGNCPIVDTWWQTETGGVLMVPLPGVVEAKPGAAMRPFFGIEPVLVDEKGEYVEGEGAGKFCMARSWPGQMQDIWKTPIRMYKSYFEPVLAHYFSGDGALRDKDGDIWITGRMDDVMNISGHRIGSAEIESALVLHDKVSEAAVVGIPHPVKGETLYAFVTLSSGEEEHSGLKSELVKLVRKEIGPIALVEGLQFTPDLPKTRSGKIMRRILRKIANGENDGFGDTSTLADPSVVEKLLKGRVLMNF